jgi:hypothetical protein
MSNERTHFDRLYALSSSEIGFEFEFYTNMLKGRAAESLGKLLKKKVIVSEKYHSQIPVNSSTFKLEPDYSGGGKMMEFITGPLPYNEAIPIMIKTLKWIDENGWTNDRCAFQFSVSFDKSRRDIKEKMENLDRLKFILGLDEGKIYDKFGTRIKNVYAKSIKRIIPRNRFSILENITSIDPKMYKVPDDKYYGVNFTKLSKGYLEFRYLGNRDYQKKIREIRDVVDYVLLYLYDMLSGRISGYTKDDLAKLQGMMKDYSKVVKSFNNPKFFFNNYPDLHIFVDLKGWEENIKTYFPVIRDKLFELVVEGNVTSGFFNYDTTTGKYQLKDARTREAVLIDGVDLILCDIKNGVLRNCNIHNCDIKKSSLEDCNVVGGSKLYSCKVKSTIVEFTNELKDCFIDCEKKNINCKIIGGVFRSGNLGDASEVSKETYKVKGWDEIRNNRFVTDSRLKDLNDRFNVARFGNMNY